MQKIFFSLLFIANGAFAAGNSHCHKLVAEKSFDSGRGSSNEYYAIPQINEKSHSFPPGTARRANDFLSTLSRPAHLSGPPESESMTRDTVPNSGAGTGIILEGGGAHLAELDTAGQRLLIKPADISNGGGTYDGIRYYELPNSTLNQTQDPVTKRPRSYLISRGVRHYTTIVDLNTGTIEPQNYVSDILLFEIENGIAEYRSRLLKSIPEKNIFFEDPRISVVHNKNKTKHVFLSMTDYSPHLLGSNEPFAMNRFVELKFDKQNQPLPLEVGEDGKPIFSNLSPRPRRGIDGLSVISVDAKNANIALNEANQLVVRTRLRPNFSSPEIQALAGENRWNYGEQVFVFRNYEEFSRYNWDHCLEDLFEKTPTKTSEAGGRIRPILAEELLRDTDLQEVYSDPRILLNKGKGMGPGTPPVRFKRIKNRLYVSDGKNAPNILVGTVPKDFPLRDGETTYISFDHEIRYFKDERNGNGFIKRHYSLVVKEFSSSLTTIKAYFADALQPVVRHERGYNSGIVDLQHAYVMGRELVQSKDGKSAKIRISLGASDAHTEVVMVDPIKLLMEMSPGSSRWLSGQVYKPKGRYHNH